jgi:hypothetical protein
VPHLAGLDEFTDGAGDVFNGHVRVDAVLVEQGDGVDAPGAARSIRAPRRPEQARAG